MDEQEIQRLNGEIREAEATEARTRAEADGLLARIRSANEDPFAADNIAKLNDAYKPADAARARAADLKALLNTQLGVQVERAVEGRKDEETTVALRFLGSAEYRSLVDSGRLRHTGARIDTMPTEVVTRDALVDALRFRLFDNAADVGSGLLTPDYTNKLVEQFTRRVRLLDRITIGRTDTDTVDWVIENARTDAAAETAYGTALPEASYGFSHRQTTAKRAGHHVVATRGILADAGQSRTLIDGRLMSGLDRRIESQLISGNGVGENLKGIDHADYTGILTQALGADTKLDAIHKAMTKIRIATESQVEPIDLWIHPNDYEELVLSKDANGNYQFGRPDTNIAPSIWGLKPVVSTLATEGAPKVADFKEAATLWVREGASIAASDSHSDFFLKGLVAVKVETRVAFALTQEKAICDLSGF